MEGPGPPVAVGGLKVGALCPCGPAHPARVPEGPAMAPHTLEGPRGWGGRDGGMGGWTGGWTDGWMKR